MTTQSPESSSTPEAAQTQDDASKDSYVKLAMRNMVKKGGKSLFHFFLTASALLGVLVGLAYITR